MSSKKLSTEISSDRELASFLSNTQGLPSRLNSAPKESNRLMFALDATASRQPSWDRACHIQANMFTASSQLGGLDVQLCYYRSINEFHFSPWLNGSQALLDIMNGVYCVGGYTQIEKILNHAIAENTRQTISALVFIGDAIEEDHRVLGKKAGQLGLLGVPLFIFQEGSDTNAKSCFQRMASLSKGAYAAFDETSADQLAQLLGAVATFASGGYDALEKLSSAAAKHLLTQLKT